MPCFLLAVYLPILLVASFHVHTAPLPNSNVNQTEAVTTELDGSDCLLCQFLQLPYKEAVPVSLSVNLTEMKASEQLVSALKLSVTGQTPSLRAPPVLL